MDKDTKLCISIANKPGNIGATLHNAAYKFLKLNFVYIPFKPESLKSTIISIRNFNIRGCSVSMPYKIKIKKYLDQISECGNEIGNINTIVNSKNKLIGYNTDFDSVKWSIERLNLKKNLNITILGNGGMGQTFFKTLSLLGFQNIIIAARKKKNINQHNFIKWEKRIIQSTELLINATPIGMIGNSNEIPIDLSKLKNIKYVIDAVSNPFKTKLVEYAKKRNLKVITGYELALRQTFRQFEIYTNRTAPKQFLKKKLLSYLNGTKK